MNSYNSISGKESGVIAYEIGEDYIVVEFRSNRRYKYSYLSAGIDSVNIMKELAIQQSGLSTYIAKNKPSYE